MDNRIVADPVLLAEPAATLELLRARASTLAGDFSGEVAPYNTLPHSLRDADFVPSAKLNLELFFRYVIEHVEPSVEDTQPLIDRAVTLVHDGMGLTEVLTNYRVGAAFFWSQLIPLLDRDEYRVVPEVGLRLTEYMGLIMARIATALVEDARQPRWDILERQHEVADALLSGREPGGWAVDPESPLAPAFLIAVVRLGEPTPGTLTRLRSRIAHLPGTLLHRDSGAGPPWSRCRRTAESRSTCWWMRWRCAIFGRIRSSGSVWPRPRHTRRFPPRTPRPRSWPRWRAVCNSRTSCAVSRT